MMNQRPHYAPLQSRLYRELLWRPKTADHNPVLYTHIDKDRQGALSRKTAATSLLHPS